MDSFLLDSTSEFSASVIIFFSEDTSLLPSPDPCKCEVIVLISEEFNSKWLETDYVMDKKKDEGWQFNYYHACTGGNISLQCKYKFSTQYK